MGILLISMRTQSVWTGGIAHAEEQSSPTHKTQMTDFRLISFSGKQSCNDYRDFKDYLERFPTGQFVVLAHRRPSRIKITVKGSALLEEHGSETISIAVCSNDIDLLEWMKAQGTHLNARKGLHNTLMREAAQSNAVDAIAWLIAHGTVRTA